MSFYHKHIVWQGKDKSWSIGFFKRVSNAPFDYDEDYDPEWEDDYDESIFENAWSGFMTAENASEYACARLGNPGYMERLPYNRQSAKECAEYDEMLKAFKDPAYAKVREERIIKARVSKFRRSVRDNLRQEGKVPQEGLMFHVRYALSKNYDGTGISTAHTSRLIREGDWLVQHETIWNKIGAATGTKVRKVWNTKTLTPATNVIAAERTVARRRW